MFAQSLLLSPHDHILLHSHLKGGWEDFPCVQEGEENQWQEAHASLTASDHCCGTVITTLPEKLLENTQLTFWVKFFGLIWFEIQG